MIVREIVTLLGVRTNQADIRRAEGGMNRLVGAAKVAIAAFAAFKLFKWAKDATQQVAELGDKFHKLALRTGESSESLQALAHVANLGGTSIETLETAIKKLQVTAVEASDGVATYKDEFDRLGISATDSEGRIKSFSELLPEIADGMVGLETDTERTAVAVKLLGRAGTELLPMLKQGSAAINEQMKEVAALGGIMDDVLVQQSADYVDNQARVAVAFQGIKNAIGKGLLPVLIEMQNGFVDWLKVNGKWIRQGLALVFSRLGQIVKRVGGFFGRLAAQFAEWSKKLDPVSKSLLKISAIALGVAATLMLPGGSIILMGALLALLIEDFEVWREGGNSAIGELIKGFDKLFDTNVEQDAKDFFNGLNQFWFDYFTDSEKAWDKFGFEVKEILKGYLDTYIDMWKLMGSKYLDIWKFIGTSIVNAWDKYWSDLRALQDKQNAEFTAKFEKFKTKLGEIWNALGTSFSEMFPGLEESWDTFWDELFQSSSDFVDKIVDSFLRLKDAIIQPIKDVSKEIRSVFGLEDVPDNVVQIAKGAKSLAGGQATRETFSGPRRASRFGALPSSVAVSQNNKTDIHVQAAPGQSVNSLAQSIDGQARKVQEQDLRRAAKAFVPKKAAAQ